MIDTNKLADALTEMFIGYQWRLDNPMPIRNETFEDMYNAYRTNVMFRNKVECLVGAVVGKVIEVEE